jgi:hypothetical protein
MALRGRDNYTGAIRDDIPEEWVERWPDDYTILAAGEEADPATAPAVTADQSASADDVKEQADGN